MNQLLANLSQQGVQASNIIILGNGEEVPEHFQNQGWSCRRSPERLSIGGIRNYALAMVDTPLLLYCDADDLIVPGALTSLVNCLSANPEVVLALGYNRLITGQRYSWPSAADFAHRPLLLLLRQLAWNRFYLATGALLRVDALRKIGGFPEINLAEDGASAAALLAIGQVAFLQEDTRVYQVHPLGLCQRGHNRWRWRQAYYEQRLWLAHNPALPLWLRVLARCYAPLHYGLAMRLKNRARYDNC